MKYINIHETKTHLSQYLELVSKGEDIIICKAGTPIAKLTRYEQKPVKRIPGIWEGKVQMADDFDETPVSVKKLFYKL